MMIEFMADKLTKRYGRFTALENFDLKIEKGECIALLGPNGAGKSTLLKLSTNLIHPTSGSIKIGGIEVQNDPMRALEKVGPLVELPEFYTYLSGKEILDFVLRIKGAGREKVKDETQRLSELLKMDLFMDKKCGTYSRGMKQRLALGCAMAMDPEVLILDEPTFGLDPRGMREFVDLITRLNKKEGKTVILSTHLIEEAREIAGRVVIIDHGQKQLEMVNERETNLMNITLYNNFDSVSLNSDFISIVSTNGRTVTVMVQGDHDNDEVIKAFAECNYRVQWVEPTNQIEKKYMELIQ
jgi:ABC-type multidrug transport system, ATPase component